MLERTFDVSGETNHFTLHKRGSRSFKQGTEAGEQSYYVKLKNPDASLGLGSLTANLKVLFEVLIDELKREFGEGGWARIFIKHEEMKEKLILKTEVIKNITADDIMMHIERMLHSADFIPADNKLIIAVAAVKSLRG